MSEFNEDKSEGIIENGVDANVDEMDSGKSLEQTVSETDSTSTSGQFREAPIPLNGKKTQFRTPRKNRGQDKGCFWVIIILTSLFFLMGIVGIFFFLIIAAAGISDIPMKNSALFYEEEVIDGSSSAEDKIVVIEIQGVIMSGNAAFYQVAESSEICNKLAYIQQDPDVKAVILRLNTPGGEVVASDVIHHNVMKLKDNMNIPVIASMDSVAASGGYYIAVAADHIVANRLTMTGSIGVIMQSYEYCKLLEKIGVEAEVFKSGAMKDILNGAKPTTQMEKTIIQNMINETYNEFVRLVAEGRKGLTADQIKNSQIGDGRILTGKQAFELGLVDQLGFFEDSIQYAANSASLTPGKYKVVRYRRPFSLAQMFGGPSAKASKISIELPGKSQFSSCLEPGKMYFLPTFQ